MNGLDPRALRDAFGRFMTGVTVVTTVRADGVPVGFTANSFTSVSMEPPLLLVCPGKFLSSYATFSGCKSFAVSILAEGQESISNTFASSKGNRFAEVATRIDGNGVPVIDGSVATFSCNTHEVHEAGDHAILIGEVTAFESHERAALGYQTGNYFSIGLERAAQLATAPKTVCGAIIQMLDTVLLRSTSDGYQPPQLTLPNTSNLAHSLAAFLSKQGVDAEIGPVYSVFDDVAMGTHYAYLLASAHTPKPENDTGGLRAIPIVDLPTLRYTTEATAVMMRRFSQEAQTRDFTLYLGDAEQGDKHKLKDRS